MPYSNVACGVKAGARHDAAHLMDSNTSDPAPSVMQRRVKFPSCLSYFCAGAEDRKPSAAHPGYSGAAGRLGCEERLHLGGAPRPHHVTPLVPLRQRVVDAHVIVMMYHLKRMYWTLCSPVDDVSVCVEGVGGLC